MWLEEFISRSNFATVTITHDRVFLQKVSNRIIEIDPRYEGGMLSVNGDYATYLELREQTLGAQEKREIILKNTLRREVEWLRQGVKARGTKQQARIQRAGELKKEVSELETRNLNRKALINFEGAEKNPKKLIEATDISKSYGENELFSHVNLLLSPGSRLGILGRNGQGKSTLIRVLLKTEEPTSGSVKHADNIRISYFDQAREALDPLTTVSKVICPSGDKVTYRGELIHYKGYLDRFLFTKEQMDFPVGKLSGGEQSRLLLAKLMLTTANVLVLDEPTNDLDVATLNILQDCLTEFPGSIILVTHDRYFLDQVATKILAFPVSMTDKSKNLTSFSDLSQWENWYEEEILKAKEISLKKTNEVTPLKLKKQKLSFKEQKELESMESKISECEKEIETLQREITLPENMSRAAILAQLSQELEEKQSCLEKLYKRWSELESH